MACLSKEENEIINVEFKKASADELLIIKKLIIDVKNHKGLYQDVVKHGRNLYNSKNNIIQETGLSEKISGRLAMILWSITNPEVEAARRLKIKITEAAWVFEDFLCKHPSHRNLNGKKYSIRKGIRIGFFKYIHPGQLVGCGCLSRPIIPGLKNS
ncbi:hypothetical protein H2998_13950 [Escherichia coli]|jgi:hypothetical protein|uniref:hypothetical protein n=1 Tax=Escherichia coli TaxID=562 RepID=UPI00077F8E1B|nr:hypothetical protein [Escherichia coli]EEV7641574.1 hypothetical protein [Escherichia coli]EFA5241131.1 hypothetical protein [Escherichia coli]EFA9336369.1 hypothetical protein [Escherichia coli]EFB8834805.1 hypothetical protein [Escherichia coli]EFH7990508.1 hypothetical protein [Escherichia coli]